MVHFFLLAYVLGVFTVFWGSTEDGYEDYFIYVILLWFGE